MVRRKPPKLVGLWPRLSIGRPKRFATRLVATTFATCFSANPEQFCLAFRIPRKTADVYLAKSPQNGRAAVAALRDLKFELTEELRGQIESGKDFVQLKNGPFDIDLIFAPDGIERFEDAWQRHVDVEGFPVCHLDDIIASKEATGRAKDHESLPRLKSFREYWLKTR